MKRLINFLFEIGTLRKIARSHRQSFLTDDLSDNIASHSYRVSAIGYLLAKQENADSGKVLKMCVFHDIGETRSGDQNWINKGYVKVFEDEILNDQLKDLTQDNELLDLMKEYQKRESLEAKITKDADTLDQLLLELEYAQRGNKLAQEWADDTLNRNLFTESAKKFREEILKTKPSDWIMYHEERRTN